MAERKTSCMQISLLIWVMFAGFLIPAMSIRFEDDQKNYYSPPDPNAGTPPTPPTGHHGSTPPHHGTPPSHGSYNPTPSTPSTPSTPNCGNPPSHSTPSNPPSGYNPPPYGGGGSPPVTVSPPISIDPGTPTLPGVPTPPYFPSPSPPTTGTCTYWSTHPGLIWGLLGWWGTLGHAFGVTSLPGFGANMSLQQALTNTHTDGFGALYREGTAAWLNSMVNNRFPFNTKQVRQNFVAALHSDSAAAAQAHLFKLANEGHLKPRP